LDEPFFEYNKVECGVIFEINLGLVVLEGRRRPKLALDPNVFILAIPEKFKIEFNLLKNGENKALWSPRMKHLRKTSNFFIFSSALV
jgi:hypothetical protein